MPWLAINAVHRDSLSTSRAVKSSELKRNPKLSTEKQEPDKGNSDHRDTYADDKQQQNRRAGFGLTRFHGCFDHDAVLCLHQDCHLDFGCEVGTVAAAARDDRGLDDLVAGRGRRSRREPQAVPIAGGDDVIKWGKCRLYAVRHVGD